MLGREGARVLGGRVLGGMDGVGEGGRELGCWEGEGVKRDGVCWGGRELGCWEGRCLEGGRVLG